MRTSDFDYALPHDLIAQTPVEPRDAARLLVIHRDTGAIEHRSFADIQGLLRPGDLLVGNDSRVIPARLFGHKLPTGGSVEMLLLRKHHGASWEVLLKPGRRVRPGTRIAVSARSSAESGVAQQPDTVADVLEVLPGGARLVSFSPPIDDRLPEIGQVPLPPYIHTQLSNPERYQTVYSRATGSVAAPTAGLHFTPELIAALERQGVRFAFVTLHISLDTFRPVKEEDIGQHQMYTEYCELSAATSKVIRETQVSGRRVIAVGTTSVRVLETAAGRGLDGQGLLVPFVGPTSLFIYPGFEFRCVDAMLTNFHLPRSTLLMLVSAFAGPELIRRAYDEAIARRYRFYSFGDASFIL